MIVPRPIVGKILRGEATMVYRLATTRQPKVAERQFVKTRQTDPIACHILVSTVVTVPLGSVTFDQARACGYRTTADAKAAWILEQDLPWINRQLANELPFPDEPELVARFDLRWAPRLAHRITFHVDHSERPRLLANRNARTDYVEHPAQAMPHEPEAVPATIQKHYAREGHQGWAARELQREADREALGLEQRLRLARIEARAAGIDVDRVEESILKRIRALESKVRRRA